MNAKSDTIVVAQPTNRVSPVRLGREQDAGMAFFPPGQLAGTQIPADWGQNDPTKPDYIKNKPTIPSEPADIGAAAAQHTHAQTDVTGLADALAGKAAAMHTHTKGDISDFPTNVGAFTNDAGYLTSHQELRYSLDAPEPTTSGTTTAVDRAVNTIDLTDATGQTITQLDVTFPASVSGKARDFFLRIKTAGTALATVTFTDGSSAADVEIGADDLADWNKTGTHLVLFTEVAQGKFLASKKFEEATP